MALPKKKNQYSKPSESKAANLPSESAHEEIHAPVSDENLDGKPIESEAANLPSEPKQAIASEPLETPAKVEPKPDSTQPWKYHKFAKGNE